MNRVLFLSLALLLSTSLWAEESVEQLLEGFDDVPLEQPVAATSGELDDLMSGFDEPSAAIEPEQKEQAKLENWTLTGVFSLQGEYGYAHDAPLASQPDYRGLSHLRSALNLGLDYRFSDQWRGYMSGHLNYDAGFLLNGRSNYTDSLLDAEESEVEFDEAWLQGQLSSNIDLTIGRQIVVWGKSDNLSVTNLLNPIDNRAAGMVDIKDLRLPLAMAKLDYYVGSWGLSAIVIPEMRFNKNPIPGSEFYPYPTTKPIEIIPDHGGSNSEIAFAANGRFSGWDLSLYHSQLYGDTPYKGVVSGFPVLQHSRIKMNGAAANWVVGIWLLKGEAARLNNLRDSDMSAAYSRTDLLIGAEYGGLPSATLSMEMVERRPDNRESTRQLALSARKDLNHERTHLMALLLLNNWKIGSGGVLRLSGEYELSDAMAMTLGVVDYLDADSPPYSGLVDNDRLFARFEYSF